MKKTLQTLVLGSALSSPLAMSGCGDALIAAALFDNAQATRQAAQIQAQANNPTNQIYVDRLREVQSDFQQYGPVEARFKVNELVFNFDGHAQIYPSTLELRHSRALLLRDNYDYYFYFQYPDISTEISSTKHRFVGRAFELPSENVILKGYGSGVHLSLPTRAEAETLYRHLRSKGSK